MIKRRNYLPVALHFEDIKMMIKVYIMNYFTIQNLIFC